MEQKRGRGRARGAGRGRGSGRGRGYHNQLYQDIPSVQRRGQRNQSRRNDNNYYSNGYISPQTESFSRTDYAARHEEALVSIQPEHIEATSSKQRTKMRTFHPEELGIELKHKSAVAPFLPRKPEKPGNLGKRIRLISNCFPIEIPSGYVYHYDVEIKKRTVNAESEAKSITNGHSNSLSEVKTTTDDRVSSESVTKTRSDDPSNLESEAKEVTDDQSNSDCEGKADDHKKYRCLNTKINRKVFSHMIDTEKIFDGLYPAFDGKKNLYTRQELQADFPFICEIIMTNENYYDSDFAPQELRQDVYEVRVKPVKKHDTTSCAINLDSVHAFFEGKTDSLPEEAMMAVETILRHTPCLRLTPVGRSFYYSPNPKYLKPIGGGIEIWFGYHQSTRLGQWKPFVNLDPAATTFLSERPVLDYIADAIGVSTDGLRRIPVIEENCTKKINHQLKNKEIRVTHLKYRRRYHIVKLTNVSAHNTLIQGKDLSVADYFKQQHGIELKYPNLPCLQVKPEGRGIFLPLEVCEFTPGQHYKSELTPSQKSNMIRFTTISPLDRFQEIGDIVKSANFDSDKCTREFNLKVSRTPLELEGRVLDSPSLMYANEKKVRPRNGTWNMRDTQFLKGGEISHCMIIAFQYHKNLGKFAELLVDIGENMGIKIRHFPKTKIVDINDDIETLIKEAKKQADLVVVVIPNHKEEKRIYTCIKKAAETLIGLRTQCIKEERLDDMYKDLSYTDNQKGCQIVRNLCLKINAKTGGENYTLLTYEIPKILCKPVIIIGADVSHPPPTETENSNKFKQPSIAACVGSLDSFCKRFAVAVRPQPKTKENSKETRRTEEIIGDLENMVMELLKAFYRHTHGQKPEKIILYRDGVSEGEYAAVKNREVLSVRKACMRLGADYEPPITCIVVQKRHHIRFKTKDPRDAIKENMPAGTVADTVVTHPLNYDYYLCSHPGMKGTSRPSYYTVIHDDNAFSANDLQKMTYQFCHMYVRCTKSISIPAPVAYAHLVAYRARKYLNGLTANDFNTNNNSSAIHTPTLQDIYKKISVVDDFKGSMYFV